MSEIEQRWPTNNFWRTRERVTIREPPTTVEGASLCCVYPPSLSSDIAENHVLWRLSHSENLHRAEIQLGFFFCFCFSFGFLVGTRPTCCFLRKSEVCFFKEVPGTCFPFFFSLFGPGPRSFTIKCNPPRTPAMHEIECIPPIEYTTSFPHIALRCARSGTTTAAAATTAKQQQHGSVRIRTTTVATTTTVLLLVLLWVTQ